MDRLAVGTGGYPHDTDADADDLRGAAEEASQHAGDSGDSDLFSSILNVVGNKRQALASEDVDEDETIEQHRRVYNGNGGHQVDSSSLGSAAALQALKVMIGESLKAHGSQTNYVALAMAEATPTPACSRLWTAWTLEAFDRADDDANKKTTKSRHQQTQPPPFGTTMSPAKQPQPPPSYEALSITEISFKHVPAGAPTATRTIILRLDRPSANNAFTDTMVGTLVDAFNTLSSDPRVKCIVFTSADARNKIFCPGMDLNGATASQEKGQTAGGRASTAGQTQPPPPPPNPASRAEVAAARAAHRDGGAQVSLAIYNCAKPVICAINGHAVGVGITMTLPCNLRVVSEDAKVGFVFARRAFNMEACSSFFLPRLLGMGKALAVCTTGAVYSASDPYVRDLFAEIVPAGRVVARAVELAEEIAGRTSIVASRAMKDLIYRGAASPEEAYLLESRVFYDLFNGKDSKEGIASFLQKREPEFKAVWEEDRPTNWPWWDAEKLTTSVYLHAPMCYYQHYSIYENRPTGLLRRQKEYDASWLAKKVNCIFVWQYTLKPGDVQG
ncbi:ClpP/crotonase-like domain-containing protein [Microdochium trichocladiopsis]|uniref:ClpP/crotonase-like domain-containing protein n=1 Tax=Microdochium trichocladiopsis TaxID=1682393 RepID=A0A9P9BNF5_9PEZI|nr:ClpP/crotonase-like domain-containing protein [Microdochium trichocladiopsis]KAH7027671.1 ClpP/crotonase-like domain-containing protein [Microdochium trichocladiopsis]